MNHSRPPERPSFLITIDTEGDNLWSRPREVTTHNADHLPRFQELCERHGLKPTYLTDWDMVHSPAFAAFARAIVEREVGEIGMHLHAWNTPPLWPLTVDDDYHHHYLIEYPEDQMREKVRVLTAELEHTFGTKMISHRAGRWSLDDRYARILAASGYLVDCSVTPHVSWKPVPGAPQGNGGTDFSSYPERSYFLDLEDIARPGSSPLLEVPVSIVHRRRAPLVEMADTLLGDKLAVVGRRIRGRFPPYTWLRPNGRNLQDLLTVLGVALEDGRDHVEFMLHSSELMPGGSPTFPRVEDITRLYSHLEAVFSVASQHVVGQTLAEYHRRFAARHAPDRAASDSGAAQARDGKESRR